MSEARWRGRPLEDYSKEELIKMVRDLGSRLRDYETPEHVHAYALGRIEMIKNLAGMRHDGGMQWQPKQKLKQDVEPHCGAIIPQDSWCGANSCMNPAGPNIEKS